jgi:uncharacterized membrane protein YhaH (DUF805 family)
MSFGKAIEAFFKRYFDFQGRSSRSEYWWFFLLDILINILVVYSDFIFLLMLWHIATIVGFIALTIRRLHDLNRSGLWFLIPLSISLGETIYLEIQTSQSSYTLEIIVLIPWIILLVYFIFPGTKGHNRFGANPIKKVINHQE